MNISETLDLIRTTREYLIEDYESVHQKTPSNKELLVHVKSLFKSGNSEEILAEVLEEDYDNTESDCKILLLTAAAVSDF